VSESVPAVIVSAPEPVVIVAATAPVVNVKLQVIKRSLSQML
jgi:hypothetical protein